MSGLKIEIEKPDKKLTLLKLSGDFEGYSALDQKAGLMDSLSQVTQGTMMVDLGGVDYIDSAALGILLEMAKEASQKKIAFGLLHVQDPVKKIIEVTQLDKIIKIF